MWVGTRDGSGQICKADQEVEEITIPGSFKKDRTADLPHAREDVLGKGDLLEKSLHLMLQEFACTAFRKVPSM